MALGRQEIPRIIIKEIKEKSEKPKRDIERDAMIAEVSDILYGEKTDAVRRYMDAKAYMVPKKDLERHRRVARDIIDAERKFVDGDWNEKIVSTVTEIFQNKEKSLKGREGVEKELSELKAKREKFISIIEATKKVSEKEEVAKAVRELRKGNIPINRRIIAEIFREEKVENEK